MSARTRRVRRPSASPMEAAPVFVLLAAAAIIAATPSDAWWRIVLALGGLATSATGVLVAFVAFQRDGLDSWSGTAFRASR